MSMKTYREYICDGCGAMSRIELMFDAEEIPSGWMTWMRGREMVKYLCEACDKRMCAMRPHEPEINSTGKRKFLDSPKSRKRGSTP